MGRRKNFKKQKPGFVILGEGKTEQYYFKKLKKIFNYKCRVKPRFCRNTSIEDFKNTIEDALEGDAIILCVIDADITRNNPKINEKFKQLKSQYRGNKRVGIYESMPSIEFWFLLHFKMTHQHFKNSHAVEKSLWNYLPNYKKREKFLKNKKWVEKMSKEDGSIDDAVSNAKSIKRKNLSYTKVWKIIENLEKYK